ncbi:carboxymuconolactone decarboxylase family protein, partial [Candidatus Entotheonella palauensis]
MAETRSIMQEVAPKLAELTADVLFGDVWERPELKKRDRSLITVAILVATYRTDQLRG